MNDNPNDVERRQSILFAAIVASSVVAFALAAAFLVLCLLGYGRIGMALAVAGMCATVIALCVVWLRTVGD